MMEFMGAFILPVILIPFLVRVTYNRWVSVGLVIVILGVIYKEATSIWIIVLAAIGTGLGGYLSNRLGKKIHKKWD